MLCRVINLGKEIMLLLQYDMTLGRYNAFVAVWYVLITKKSFFIKNFAIGIPYLEREQKHDLFKVVELYQPV